MPNASEIATAYGLGQAHAAYVEAYGNESVVNWDSYASYRRMTGVIDQGAWKEAFCEGYDEYFADQD